MGKQFENISSRYGAPMGRSDSPLGPLKIRVFRVRINQGGYDDGGAYWGIGQPLYCATCAEGGRQFVRARNRADAVAKLDLGPGAQLLRRDFDAHPSKYPYCPGEARENLRRATNDYERG